ARRNPDVVQPSVKPAPATLPTQLARVRVGGPDAGGNESCRLLDSATAIDSLRRAPRARARMGRIGFVGSLELAERLAPDVQVEVLREGSWRTQLAECPVDYVLLETSWAGALDDWRYAMVQEAGRGQGLVDLLAYCRANSLPSVLWFREDASNYHRFSWLVPMVDRVYAI